jgi:hypothetical protein
MQTEVKERTVHSVSELRREGGRLLADLSVMACEETDERRRQLAQIALAQIDHRAARAEVVSRFRHRNAHLLLEAAFAQPSFALAEQLGLPTDDASVELAADAFRLGTRDADAGPLLVFAPREIRIGCRYALTGVNLGARGSVFIDIGDERAHSTLCAAVVEWNDTSVVFETESSLGGVPYDAPARIRIVTDDGQASNAPHLTVQPAEHAYAGESHPISEAGYVGISRHAHFSSPPLPPQFRPAGPVDGVGGPPVQITYAGSGAPATACVVGDLGYRARGDALRALVRYGAEWMDDLRLWVTFYVRVPQGFEIPPGWSQVW